MSEEILNRKGLVGDPRGAAGYLLQRKRPVSSCQGKSPHRASGRVTRVRKVTCFNVLEERMLILERDPAEEFLRLPEKGRAAETGQPFKGGKLRGCTEKSGRKKTGCARRSSEGRGQIRTVSAQMVGGGKDLTSGRSEKRSPAQDFGNTLLRLSAQPPRSKGKRRIKYNRE